MRGIVGLLPGGEVTTGIAAIRGSDLQIVVVVEVASGAGHSGVAIGEWKSGGAVIKSGGGPTDGGVTRGAVCDSEGWAGLRMRGTVGLLPSGEMATGVAAVRGSNLQIVIVVEVASGTSDVGVTIGQQKSGGAVIEGGAEPTVEAVTALAICGGECRPCAGVIRIRGSLPVFQVAGIALG